MAAFPAALRAARARAAVGTAALGEPVPPARMPWWEHYARATLAERRPRLRGGKPERVTVNFW